MTDKAALGGVELLSEPHRLIRTADDAIKFLRDEAMDRFENEYQKRAAMLRDAADLVVHLQEQVQRCRLLHEKWRTESYEALLPAQRGEGNDVKRVAQIVYEAMRWVATNRPIAAAPEWRPNGNSLAQDRARDAARAAIAALPRRTEGWVSVPSAALRWLFGEEGEFECPPDLYFRGKPPAFWWRSVFRKMITAAPAAGAERRGEDS